MAAGTGEITRFVDGHKTVVRIAGREAPAARTVRRLEKFGFIERMENAEVEEHGGEVFVLTERGRVAARIVKAGSKS